MTDQPDVHSLSVPAGVSALTLVWEPVPQVEAYVLCRLHVAIQPESWRVLLAGGLDLLMERWVLPAALRAVREDEPGGVPHRLLLARFPGGRLAPVTSLHVWDGPAPEDVPSLADYGPLARSWTDGVRVGRPPVPAPAPPRAGSRTPGVRAVLDEPGGVSAKPPTFIERSLSVREGARLRPGGGAPALPRSPLEAWESQVAPRLRPGGRLPDLKAAPAAPAAPDAAAEEPGEPRPLRWAVVASPPLLRDPPAARAALRLLRGFLRVALVGLTDRPAMDRWAEQLGVPLDGVFALPGDSATLARALGCRPDELVVFTLPGESAPPRAQHVEVEPEGFAAAAETLCDEL